jgi:hypothetical protein
MSDVTPLRRLALRGFIQLLLINQQPDQMLLARTAGDLDSFRRSLLHGIMFHLSMPAWVVGQFDGQVHGRTYLCFPHAVCRPYPIQCHGCSTTSPERYSTLVQRFPSDRAMVGTLFPGVRLSSFSSSCWLVGH